MSTFETVTTSIRVQLAVLNKNQSWLAGECGKTKAWLSDRMSGRVTTNTEDIDLIASKLGLYPFHLTSGELIPHVGKLAA